MADKVQFRRDTFARWESVNPVLMDGEIGFVTDRINQYKLGDGVKHWNDLPLQGFNGNIVEQKGNDPNSVMSQKKVTEELDRIDEELENFDKVVANPEEEATETLTKIKIDDTVYTAPQGPQGPEGPANTLSIGTVQSGEEAAASITGESPEQVLNLTLPKGDKGDKGDAGHNPNLGTYLISNYSTDAPTTNILDGDYIVVVDNTVTPETSEIYKWNSTAWVTTGRDANDATFATNELVGNVSIVNDLTTGGEHDVLSAEQGKELGRRSNRVDFVGQGDALVKTSVYCSKGHTYLITPSKTNVSFSGVSYTSASYVIFSIRNYVGENIVKSYISIGADKKATYSLLPTYEIVAEDDGFLTIVVRMTDAEGVSFMIEDITTITSMVEKFNNGEPIHFDKAFLDSYFPDVEKIGYQINRNVDYYGTPISSYIWWTMNNYYNRIVDLPVDAKDISVIKIKLTYNLDSARGAILVDADDNIVSFAVRTTSDYGLYAFMIVPDTAKKIYYTYHVDTIPDIVIYPHSHNDEVLHVTSDNTISVCPAMSIQSPENVKSESIGVNVFKRFFDRQYPPFDNWFFVPIKGYKYISARVTRSSYENGFAFVNGSGNIISVPVNTTGHDMDYVCAIPDDAKYALMSYVTRPYNVYLYKNAITNVQNRQITFTKGTINGDGSIGATTDGNRLVSSPVSLCEGFYLRVQDDYCILSAHVYDLNGNPVGIDYMPNAKTPNVNGFYSYPYQYFDYKMFSTLHILPQYVVRFVVARADNGAISTTDNIVKKLQYINCPELVKTQPDNIAKYEIMRGRLYRLFNGWWKALADIFPSTYATGTNYAYDFFLGGNSRTGIPYSEASEYSKYVGQNVSFMTFFTALLNKRSVMYTERINSDASGFMNGNKSKYGLAYAGLSQQYAASYYGTVCTGLTGYLMGLKNVFISDDYHEIPSRLGLVMVTNASADNVKVMDVIWNSGHCSIISDIYKDRFGNVKYIAWAEQTKPTPYITLYTPEEFEYRLQAASCEVYRYENWNDLQDDGQQTPYIQIDNGDYPSALTIDPDISTFAGEYVVFTTMADTDADNNNKAILNIHRGGDKYTKIQIFNETDDVENATPIEYSLADANVWISQSDIYDEDAADKEDWVMFDLKQITTLLSAGKYKARLVNSDSSVVSGFTHWQMVEIALNVVDNGDNTITCTYSAVGGVPYLIRKEKRNGIYQTGWPSGSPVANGFYEIDSNDTSPLTLQWSDFTTYNYVKLFVKSDYGDIVIRVSMA